MKGPKKPKVDGEELKAADAKGARSTSFQDGGGQRTIATTCDCNGAGCEKCKGLGFRYE